MHRAQAKTMHRDPRGRHGYDACMYGWLVESTQTQPRIASCNHAYAAPLLMVRRRCGLSSSRKSIAPVATVQWLPRPDRSGIASVCLHLCRPSPGRSLALRVRLLRPPSYSYVHYMHRSLTPRHFFSILHTSYVPSVPSAANACFLRTLTCLLTNACMVGSPRPLILDDQPISFVGTVGH